MTTVLINIKVTKVRSTYIVWLFNHYVLFRLVREQLFTVKKGAVAAHGKHFVCLPSQNKISILPEPVSQTVVQVPLDVCYFPRHQIRLVQEQLFTVENGCLCLRMVGFSYVNSLWPSDAKWLQIYMSTLAHVIACCLTAPSHCLNQCLLMISEVL